MRLLSSTDKRTCIQTEGQEGSKEGESCSETGKQERSYSDFLILFTLHWHS